MALMRLAKNVLRGRPLEMALININKQRRCAFGVADLMVVRSGGRRMKIPSATSGMVTHHLIIADRSEAGMFAVATILDVCQELEGRISAWRNSAERFFLFIVEQKGDHMGSLTARDLDHLLGRVLPELYLELLKPSANVTFDICVEDSDVGTIDDRIAQLLIAIALETSLSQ